MEVASRQSSVTRRVIASQMVAVEISEAFSMEEVPGLRSLAKRSEEMGRRREGRMVGWRIAAEVAVVAAGDAEFAPL